MPLENTPANRNAVSKARAEAKRSQWISSNKTKLGDFWRRFSRNRTAVIGLVLILLNIAIAVFAPVIAPYDPYEQNWRNRLATPNGEHWFGTDEHGRDQLSRIGKEPGIRLVMEIDITTG